MHRNFSKGAALALGVVTLAAAAAASHDSDDAPQRVAAADARLNQLIVAHDAQAAQFYFDDFVLTTSSGARKHKGDLLAELMDAQKLRLEINQTTQVRVRVQGNAAVLTGVLHQKGIYNDKPFDAFMLVTDTWIETDTGWKLLAGQASVIPAEKVESLKS